MLRGISRMEHADGSFLDHLQFCYEYCAAHFKGHSPRVLFLHSIMGVGTNYFPMKLELVPKLQTLVSDEEFKHIEAFPSILRLLLHFDFVQELESQGPGRLARDFGGVYFHRVLDNKHLVKNGRFSPKGLQDAFPATFGSNHPVPYFLVYKVAPALLRSMSRRFQAAKVAQRVSLNCSIGYAESLQAKSQHAQTCCDWSQHEPTSSWLS
eukprot:s9182_g1.t1